MCCVLIHKIKKCWINFKFENLNVSDIDDVYIVVGPGSYTGIRVGISFVLGLKSLSLNVIPVTIFDAVCLTFKNKIQSLLMLIDSKNDEY